MQPKQTVKVCTEGGSHSNNKVLLRPIIISLSLSLVYTIHWHSRFFRLLLCVPIICLHNNPVAKGYYCAIVTHAYSSKSSSTFFSFHHRLGCCRGTPSFTVWHFLILNHLHHEIFRQQKPLSVLSHLIRKEKQNLKTWLKDDQRRMKKSQLEIRER